MKLIVGLGNPGKEYENTRHNIGFMAVDNYVKLHNLGDFKEKFNGMYIKYQLGNEQVILVKPLSFMNLSGDVVRKYVDYFKIVALTYLPVVGVMSRSNLNHTGTEFFINIRNNE